MQRLGGVGLDRNAGTSRGWRCRDADVMCGFARLRGWSGCGGFGGVLVEGEQDFLEEFVEVGLFGVGEWCHEFGVEVLELLERLVDFALTAFGECDEDSASVLFELVAGDGFGCFEAVESAGDAGSGEHEVGGEVAWSHGAAGSAERGCDFVVAVDGEAEGLDGFGSLLVRD